MGLGAAASSLLTWSKYIPMYKYRKWRHIIIILKTWKLKYYVAGPRELMAVTHLN